MVSFSENSKGSEEMWDLEAWFVDSVWDDLEVITLSIAVQSAHKTCKLLQYFLLLHLLPALCVCV
jgi:hypothetical protein